MKQHPSISAAITKSDVHSLTVAAWPSLVWLAAGISYYLAFRGPSLSSFHWVNIIGLSPLLPAEPLAYISVLDGFPSLVAAMSLVLGLNRLAGWQPNYAAAVAMSYVVMNELAQYSGLMAGSASWLDLVTALVGLGTWLQISQPTADLKNHAPWSPIALLTGHALMALAS